MLRFFIALLLASTLIIVFVLMGASAGYFSTPSYFIQSLILLSFATSVIFIYLYKAKRPDFFLQLYLLTMVVKLLAYCTYNLIMIIDDKSGAVANVVFFMATYFIFTALEIGFLYHKIAGDSKA